MKKLILTLIICFNSSLGWCSDAPQDIQLAFDNIKDDNLKRNCAEATKYLYERREEIVDILTEALPNLDWQGQDVVLRILTETESYKPDDKVISLMLDRLKDERSPGIREMHSEWHYDYILYVEDKADRFKDLLTSYIRVGNIRQLWGVTHILHKAGLLAQSKDKYTPEIVEFVISNMRDDDIHMNAVYAARICWYLGSHSISYLESEVRDGDFQSKFISGRLLGVIFGEQDYSYDYFRPVNPDKVEWVHLVSRYMEELERDGAPSISEFPLVKRARDEPGFLTGESYEESQEGDLRW